MHRQRQLECIRHCVRRWRKGGQSMLLLGLALALAEESVIQQNPPLAGLAQVAYGSTYSFQADDQMVGFLFIYGSP
jgi:hypothetical protein